MKFFRLIAHLEGISFLLILLVTMPLKYFYDMPTPNMFVGMAHGILFILYVSLVYINNEKYDWDKKTQLHLYIASVLPFGTFWADKRYLVKLAD